MIGPLKRRPVEAEKAIATQLQSFADFDPVLTSMRRRLIEFAAQEESILAQITIEGQHYRPLTHGHLPGPARFTKPKPLTPTEAAARAMLNGFAPPLPEVPTQAREIFSNPASEKVITLQRQLDAVRLARAMLNDEVAKRIAQASRLFCGEVAAEYAERVKAVTDAFVKLAGAFQQHEAFVNDARVQGAQIVFLPFVNMGEIEGALEAADRVVARANEAGHIDARAALAEAATPLPLPARDDPFADVKQRLTEAQEGFEQAKKAARTRVVIRRRARVTPDDAQHVNG